MVGPDTHPPTHHRSDSPLLRRAPTVFFPPSHGSWSYVCSEPTNPFATATLPTHLLQPCSLLRAGFVKFWLPTPRWPSRVGRRRQVAGPGPQIRGAECQDAPQQASAPVREFPKMYPTEYFAFSLGVPSASRCFSPPAAIFAGFALSAFHSSPHSRQFFSSHLLHCAAGRVLAPRVFCSPCSI